MRAVPRRRTASRSRVMDECSLCYKIRRSRGSLARSEVERTVIPVENADRFFLLAEQGALPASCVWAFRLETSIIDHDRFMQAVDRAMREYPKAASRLSGRETFFGPQLFWSQV